MREGGVATPPPLSLLAGRDRAVLRMRRRLHSSSHAASRLTAASSEVATLVRPRRVR